MRSKMRGFLMICFIFWLMIQAEGQTSKCDYKYEYRWTYAYRRSNASYYTCLLDTKQSNYDENLTITDGQHVIGHNDSDVKYVHNHVNHKLKTFSSTFCQMFSNLEVVSFGKAELESIDEDSLKNCTNLNQLWLNDNKIRELPENLLFKNSKLTYIRIYNEQLTTLPEILFQNQWNLKDLIIDNNLINFLPSNIFRSLVKLESLYLNDNKLQSINPGWFVNLQNLKLLYLQRNQISEIPSKPFAQLNNLEKLWLTKNRIKALNSDNFDGLQNIHVLFLSDNEISDLPAGVFAPLKNPKELGLHGNKLTTIHSDSFGINIQLSRVYLDDNKINAIDEKFIDNTAVSFINMTNNICSQSAFKSNTEIKTNLRKCFDNYHQLSIQIQNSCGRSLMPGSLIIGGNKIKRGSYPWIAALLRPNGDLFCGGTLVSNRKVVTAAHCIQDKGSSRSLNSWSLIVLLGFHELNNLNDTGRASYGVQNINIHPDWSSYTTSYDADIAVLILKQDVTFNEHIQPICLSSTDPKIAASTEGYVVGNGRGGYDNKYENIPKILKMPIQTNQVCTGKHYIFKDLLTGRTFCAGNGTGQGVCSGDSGSGLVVQIEDAFYLRGIVSASLGNSILGCDVDSYSVFTNAFKFIEWINGLPTIPVIQDRIIFQY